MHTPIHQPGRSIARGWARALWFALALVGCGGGVDSGGTGVTPASYANGPITGFGSVIVNGVRFDDATATVTDDDGLARSRDDLRLGMTTEVRGSPIVVDSTGANVSTARSIAFASDLLGRIDRIDAANNRLVVLGQSVIVSATTVFDDATVPGGLTTLARGEVVEVYALLDVATSQYQATRIERKGVVAQYRLRGVVSQLDRVAKAFNVGTERISYAGLIGTLPAALANGNVVRLRLQTTQVSAAWPLAAVSNGAQVPEDLDDVRLEGLISAFTSVTQFSVNGVPVEAAGVTPPVGLGLSVRVEVEGTMRSGVLVARTVEIESSGGGGGQTFELRGSITSVNAATLSFLLRGVTVEYSLTGNPTDFRGGTAANLVVGADVEARGVLSANGTRLAAARITFN